MLYQTTIYLFNGFAVPPVLNLTMEERLIKSYQPSKEKDCSNWSTWYTRIMKICHE